MQVTLYTRFQDASLAEKALGALTDHGAELKDLAAIFPTGYQSADPKTTPVEKATSGVTTTTGADAASGAAKGAGIGLGLGAVAAVASLFIPGFGIVTGGAALATALAAMAGTAAGGAVAGGVAGFMQDQGVPERVALDSEEAIKNGSAIVSVACPTGKLGEFEVLEILSKYHAESYGRSDAPVLNAI